VGTTAPRRTCRFDGRVLGASSARQHARRDYLGNFRCQRIEIAATRDRDPVEGIKILPLQQRVYVTPFWRRHSVYGVPWSEKLGFYALELALTDPESQSWLSRRIGMRDGEKVSPARS
jgi:hypothetical protein